MSEGRAAIFTPQDLCDPVSWQDRGRSLRNWMTYPNGRQPGKATSPHRLRSPPSVFKGPVVGEAWAYFPLKTSRPNWL